MRCALVSKHMRRRVVIRACTPHCVQDDATGHTEQLFHNLSSCIASTQLNLHAFENLIGEGSNLRVGSPSLYLPDQFLAVYSSVRDASEHSVLGVDSWLVWWMCVK